MAQIQQAHPNADVEVWAQDEQRLGLKPVLRRSWFAWYDSAVVPMRWRFEWFWLYGFVCPQKGHTYWWLMPRVNQKTFSKVLQDFAKHFGVGPNKRIVLVLDQARWHTTKKLEVPEGIHCVFLPAYSPELQPAERLWPLTNEAIANRYFETIEAVEEAICQRCQQLIKQPDFIRGLTLFHWWPTISLSAGKLPDFILDCDQAGFGMSFQAFVMMTQSSRSCLKKGLGQQWPNPFFKHEMS